MQGNGWEIRLGDCFEVLRTLDAQSIDALVTDPPAGISFMGKEWDANRGGRDQWVAWLTEVMNQCWRVMKPGAHGLVWAIPRTSHWTATALENAGFEVRDVITHLFGQGFPKSLDVSKAIDKKLGATREVIGRKEYSAPDIRGNSYDQAHVGGRERLGVPITKPGTPEAETWAGWGTALKPASEHWILIRKPIAETGVAANVLKHGCGAINIDGARIPCEPGRASENADGRWPANLIFSHLPECEPSPRVFSDGSTESQCADGCPVREFDQQSGILKTSAGPTARAGLGYHGAVGHENLAARAASEDGASRFFFCAKVSASERDAGLENEPGRIGNVGDERPSGNMNQRIHGTENRSDVFKKNHHPTVKPQKLMSYLVRLITPPNGIVLDPFMGSGSTGIAARGAGFRFLGIDKEDDYCAIAERRIGNVLPLFDLSPETHKGVNSEPTVQIDIDELIERERASVAAETQV